MLKTRLFLFMLLMVFIKPSLSHSKPWYSVESADELQISVYFEKNDQFIRPVYFHHLNVFGRMLKAHPTTSVYIQNKYGSMSSQKRAGAIKNYLKSRFNLPSGRIFVENFGEEEFGSSGEKFKVYFKKEDVKKMKSATALPVKKKQKPVVKPEKVIPTESVVEKNNSPKELVLSSKPFNFYIGGGVSQLEFTTEKLTGVQLRIGMRKKLSGKLFFALDSELSFYESSLFETEQYLGFETSYERVFLKTSLYFKKHNVLDASSFVFDTLDDYGVYQKIGLYIYRNSLFDLIVGGSAHFSFSNNISDLSSANILIYSSDINLVWKRTKGYDLGLVLFRSVRTYDRKSRYDERNDLIGLGLKLSF